MLKSNYEHFERKGKNNFCEMDMLNRVYCAQGQPHVLPEANW